MFETCFQRLQNIHQRSSSQNWIWSHNHAKKPKQYLYLSTSCDGAHVYMSLLNTMEVTFYGLFFFFYTLCFNIQQPILYFACIFLFHYSCDLDLLTCLFFIPLNFTVHFNFIAVFFKWCILLMYICSALWFQLPFFCQILVWRGVDLNPR